MTSRTASIGRTVLLAVRTFLRGVLSTREERMAARHEREQSASRRQRAQAMNFRPGTMTPEDLGQVIGRSDTPTLTKAAQREPTRIDAFMVTDSAGVLLGTLKFWHDTEDVASGNGRTRRINVTKREFSVCHKPLEQALGHRRMPLGTVQTFPGFNVDMLREESLRDIEDSLRRKFNAKTTVKASALADTVAAPAAAAPAVRASEPAEAAAPSAPRFTSGEQRGAAPRAQRQERVFARADTARVEHIDEGVLKAYGVDSRRIEDKDHPGEMMTIKSYFVDLVLTSGADPGMPKRIWGTDLERAIAAANVQRGDTVRVLHHGRESVAGHGNRKAGYKNVYSVETVGGPS